MAKHNLIMENKNPSLPSIVDRLNAGVTLHEPETGVMREGQTGCENHRTATWPAGLPREHSRVLAASSEQDEAEARARGVAGMFRKYYNAITEQGLDDNPVWHRRERKHATQLRQFVERMCDREWIDRHMIMTVDELAGVAHIPNAEIETPNIDWRYTRRGDRAPADLGQYEQSTGSSASTEHNVTNRGHDGV
ncbi:hypothetical protein BDK88_3728 [Natrinema hispanicum]|uniref:DUF8128 domain-containing protein n=1 Tax=Natrinema hispanicum TaxID=392421 RepID=A0A1I0JL58_9EURY|nr:hypothetical protein BDK88_3728 [Natrinema hispanicum]SEU10265.1 hypothetical protein SAMN04488694_14518 [Natrinema hispanicum]